MAKARGPGTQIAKTERRLTRNLKIVTPLSIEVF
jgi:hypothetical protein